ncbi:glycerol-3-phosphate 1-O-acyltransferase PlsY [Marivita sp. XM-24bin2]|jgi:glycerol-3-phosphate acyltransferase PlsY|uniref:glycerol-3-phosphate 1-O-acyltransferase PlsY n=1 Tax=unclassified Marivita TaxID=2632480 RepID=UPI000D7B15AD|nr:glycerol-3-phosphate 1-O-acyltransferase PlsY [Marivita sp. XM-24bin2]MCR9109517.1 glycerol-3-phosphate 1-O-acyltransferase PlsY [Paracoccaceae bacterium]PWL35312.1 MAG: acyl-phosphate glycerol 3-phosphate acyltransferase [Marivita sp. XM-24bin2]
MPSFESGIAILGLWAVVGYLLGSIPFGLVLTKTMGLGNLRDIGSGNIGATNVLRTGSKGAAAATLLLDGAKGAVAVLLARAMAGEDAAQIAALAAFIGHCFPVWLGFKGGKGVATFLGLMLALAWPVGLLACATWLATAVISRISSLSALVAASWSTLWCLVVGQGQVFVLTLILALLIIWRHRENLARLKAGTEPRIGRKKT